MNDENEQLEFDFMTEACHCDENTSYYDLCPTCLNDCLEFMAANEEDDFDYTEYA